MDLKGATVSAHLNMHNANPFILKHTRTAATHEARSSSTRMILNKEIEGAVEMK